MPKGAVSGEVIAGIEPVANTLKAIDRIADAGAFPTVCIFRPTAGADMEHWPTPSYEDMRRVMLHVYEACRRNWIPIGAAPNIEVSLVVNPDETALLAERTPRLLCVRGVPAARQVRRHPGVQAADARGRVGGGGVD